ncbi:MAG: DoxX-like family protein [Agriterribacter sp.]
MYKTVNYLIALVWFFNGLFCKLLNFVPRHQQIVTAILGTKHAENLTKIIGVLEIAMALWILAGVFRKLNAIVQSVIIITMNILEYLFVPDLLLWGRYNIIFASLFVLLILYNEFYLRKK